MWGLNDRRGLDVPGYILIAILNVSGSRNIAAFNYLDLEIWRRKWQPTPVFLPGESQGWGSLVGCHLWVAQSLTRLSDFTFTFHFHALEKEMATHSNVLAWRIPRMGEPGGYRLWGRTELDTTEVT